MTESALIDQLFRANGVTAPWVPLPATGVANHIYATNDVVLRVPTTLTPSPTRELNLWPLRLR